ncbi:uncharacterized protein [Euphorbia lathyris]|uniref:uncharacterized protein n=1 Tax=Euphorbia lathyris TaxID=212925 RepID=UPI003313794A
MNFFNSVFADEPTPPDSPDSSPDSPQNPDPNPTWSFGGLIQTLATKSESMIENYRKDLEEFGSGIRKETSVIREVASRAVKDLPGSLEVGASVAQESLETVGQAIDDIGATVWKSTSQIISHGRDSFLAPDYDDAESSDKQFADGNQQSLNLKRYSRFDMQVHALQCDLNTYCTEPENEMEYEQWRLVSFSVEERREEIDSLFSENGVIREIYNEVVPSRVDNEGFWSRYFFKLHKLKQAEEARALLVKRAISGEDEDLRWDFDDEVESSPQGQSSQNNISIGRSENAMENVSEDDVKCEEKGDNGDSCKDSDLTVVSTQSSPEEDLGWDEIEEIGMNDDTLGEEAMGSRTSTSRLVDLRKRLNAAEEEEEEDEDLNWDIEDEDDEPGNH